MCPLNQGSSWDILAADYSVPSKDFWSFRLVLTDEYGDSLDGYSGNTTMEDVPMESVVEDLQYRLDLVSPDMLLWIDNDWDDFPQMNVLIWYTNIDDYDTAEGLAMSLKIYGRDTTGAESFIVQTETFYGQPGEDEGWYTMVAVPGHHGLWDFRLELITPFGEVGAIYPYDLDEDITDVPMELWIEDPPITVAFNPNPIVTLSDVAGIDTDTLDDRNDTDYAAMIAALREVELLGIDPSVAGYYFLGGPYVKVREFLGPPEAPVAMSPETQGPIFPFYRSERQFEQVMCYYHIDHNQRYLQSLGFTNAYNAAIEVDAHGRADTAGSAFYAKQDGTGKILFGDGGIDWAEDADVILHEYGHAIQHNQAPGIYLDSTGGDVGHGNESIFMAEGFAFYWVASSTDSINDDHGFPSEEIGEWVAKAYPWPGDSNLYNIANMRYYPGDIISDPSEPDTLHLNGLIWAGTLWDIYQNLGKTIADSLVLRSHELMNFLDIENPVFGHGAWMILRADSGGYNAAHHDELCNIFEQRGIFSPGGNYKGPGAVWSCETYELGDVNCDGHVNPLDVMHLINRVYRGWDILCDDALGDIDCSGTLTPVDVTLLVNYVYKYWPFPEC